MILIREQKKEELQDGNDTDWTSVSVPSNALDPWKEPSDSSTFGKIDTSAFGTTPFGPAGRTTRNAITRGRSMAGRIFKNPDGSWAIKNRIANIARDDGYRVYRKAIDGFKKAPKTIGRYTRKAGLGILGGGTAALIGGAVGIASGDLGNAVKLATAGATAGFYGANNLGDKVAKSIGARNKELKTSFLNKDMRDYENAKFDREFYNSPENRRALTKAFGSRSDVIENMKDGSIQVCLDHGIQDANKIARTIKLRDKYEKENLKNGMSKEDARSQALARSIGMSQLSDVVSKNIVNKSSSEYLYFQRRYMKEFTQAKMDKEEAQSKVDNIIKDLNDSFWTD